MTCVGYRFGKRSV